MTIRTGLASACISLIVAVAAVPAAAKARPNATVGGGTNGALLPIGQYLTPTVAPGSTFQQLQTGLRSDGNADANGGITTALSPSGKSLLVLSSGYNTGFSTTGGKPIEFPFLNPLTAKPSTVMASTFQWVFVYDVSSGVPVERQAIPLPSSFAGLAWAPDGAHFYVSGGQDDRVYIYKQTTAGWVPDAPFIILNHNSNGAKPQPKYDGGIFKGTPVGALLGPFGVLPGAQTAGVAVSADGKFVFAANLGNDSVSVIDSGRRAIRFEAKLFTPGSTAAHGEYPLWVTPHAARDGSTDKIYVTSLRDGEVISIAASGRRTTITVGGEPGKMVLSRDGRRLFVANPDLDEIDAIDTATDALTGVISVRRPGYRYRGANPNSLALSADGATLYATLGGENAVAVIDVASYSVTGRIPTGWYPSSVTTSADGTRLFIVNTKSNAGPSPANGSTAAGNATDTTFRNEYVLASEKSGLLTVPIPDAPTLAYLSAVVDANNAFDVGHDVSPMMRFLHTKIQHVIFIQRENRTYDQILGDLPVGNGDPRLAVFPQPITPNAHALALQFADLDNFYTSGDVSEDGWNWDYQGHTNDLLHQAVPINYAGDGFNGASNPDRLQNLAVPVFASPANPGSERFTTLLDPSGRSTVEPGPKVLQDTVGTSDESPQQTGGFIWDSVIRAGLSVRHYGQYDDETEYQHGLPIYFPIVRDAAAKHAIQGVPRYAPLFTRTDPYYRGWDLDMPDEFRYEQWKTEFDGFVKNRNLPSFEFMCIMLDHTGNFSTNVAHLNTPELELASNDHAIGEIVDAVSHSPYWASTAIFIEEDDSQAGPDHVDAHRSPGFVLSPWTAHNRVVHTFYNSDSILRTMEDILGVDHLGLNDANSASMDDVFATQPDLQPYTTIIPGNLCAPPVDPTLVPQCYNPQARKSRIIRSQRSAAWWEAQTKHFSFAGPDRNDAAVYDRLLWEGLTASRIPYPSARSGDDLTIDRANLLARNAPPVGAPETNATIR